MSDCRYCCSVNLQMSQQHNTNISHKSVYRSGLNILCQPLMNTYEEKSHQDLDFNLLYKER